jgi:hypothetical protein
MVNLYGTKKIKGILELSGIKKQVKPGGMTPVTDTEFYENSVQIAVNMGYVTFQKDNQIQSSGASPSLKLRNIYHRAIRINALDGEVAPGQQFILTEDQISSSDIRAALAKGLIEIVSSARANVIEEATVKIGNIFKEKKTETELEAPIGDFLETNEEASVPKVIETPDVSSKVINTETPDPIEKTDIKDPKRKTVVWNPNRDPIAHTRTGMDAVTADGGDQNAVNISSEVNFVDQKLEAERISKHPVLKAVPQSNNEEIEFI